MLLTTDTLHHRYLANFLDQRSKAMVILEDRPFPYLKSYGREIRRRRSVASLIDNPYIHLPYRGFARRQDGFEREHFFGGGSEGFSPSLALHHVHDVNEPRSIGLIRDARPDLLISFGTGILRKRVLETECLKVNVHRGILPTYRGLDSDLWACYNHDFSNIGTTIHQLEAALDAGPIVGQRPLELRAEMKIFQLRFFTTDLAARLLGELIENDLEREAVEQDLAAGTYYSFIPPIKRAVAIRRFERFVAGLST